MGAEQVSRLGWGFQSKFFMRLNAQVHTVGGREWGVDAPHSTSHYVSCPVVHNVLLPHWLHHLTHNGLASVKEAHW